MNITKAKIAISAGIAIVVLTEALVYQQHTIERLRDENQALRQQATTGASVQAGNQGLPKVARALHGQVTFGPMGGFNGVRDISSYPPAIANKLRLIDSSKQQWALEFNKRSGDTPTWDDIRPYLVPPSGNMDAFAHAPEGKYIIGQAGQQPQFQPNAADMGSATGNSTGTSGQNACINNLRLIDSAKQQWALEHNKQNRDTPTWDDLRPYIGRGATGELPKCPDGGTYTIGSVGEKPTCSIPDHVLP